jgi:nucleoside-diphosphate-sugar epimerase
MLIYCLTFFILSRNDTRNHLYTCAVRPAAIYGPGEDRHLPRIITMARLGLLLFRIGDKTVKSDWVFVDNLVLALIMASMGLLDDNNDKGKQPIAAGQAYFICDGDGFSLLMSLLLEFLEATTDSSFVQVHRSILLNSSNLYSGVWIMNYQKDL